MQQSWEVVVTRVFDVGESLRKIIEIECENKRKLGIKKKIEGRNGVWKTINKNRNENKANQNQLGEVNRSWRKVGNRITDQV